MHAAKYARAAIFVGMFAVCAVCSKSFAVTLDVGTDNAANWSLTGGGASGATPWQLTNNISITSNGLSTGTFVTGGSLAQFNGFWYADEAFTLPADATDISLTFNGLTGDDRVVLELNGTPIGDFFLGFPNGGSGVMSFPPGPPDYAYVFTGQTAGTITTGFVPGQVNLLRLVVNNTGHPVLTHPTATFGSSTDGTDAGFYGTLSYAVPEPGVLALLPGVLLLAVRFRRPRVLD